MTPLSARQAYMKVGVSYRVPDAECVGVTVCVGVVKVTLVLTVSALVRLIHV